MHQHTAIKSEQLNSASSNIQACACRQREGGVGGTSAELCHYKSASPACMLRGKEQPVLGFFVVFFACNELNSGKKRGALSALLCLTMSRSE